MATYRIVRYFQRDDVPRDLIARHVTLDEAQEHCNDPETSSSTATSDEATRRTEIFGPWFDGYEEE